MIADWPVGSLGGEWSAIRLQPAFGDKMGICMYGRRFTRNNRMLFDGWLD